MKKSPLFQALVVGGALMVSGSCQSPAPKTSTASATKNKTPNKGLDLPATETAGKSTFCKTDNVQHCQDGKPVKGIVCCWGTSC